MSTKARELAELSRTIIDTSDATAITINADEEVTLADDLFLADGKKAVFGAGSDLQIYHDGNDSYIAESGAGDLIITSPVIRPRTDQFTLNNAANTEHLLTAAEGGSVALYYDAVKKLETDSSGVSISGVLTVIDGSTSAPSISNDGDSNTGIYFPADDQLGLLVGGSRKLHVTSSGVAIQNGDLTVSGTLNGITTTRSVSGNRWGVLPEVASNGVLEIGRYLDFHTTDGDTSDYGARFDYDGSKMILTSAFETQSTIKSSSNISIEAASGNPQLLVKTAGAGNNPNIRIQADSNYWDIQTLFSNADDELDLRYNGSSKLIIKKDGNVGIGTNNPGVALDVNGGSNTQLRLTASDSSGGSIINFGDQDNVAAGRIIYSHSSNSFSFKTNNVNNRLVIDSSGNVGIGVTPSASHYETLEIGTVGSGITGRGAADTHILSGLYWDGASTRKYAVSGVAVGTYQITNGIHYWSSPASGTAGNTATVSANMTLDASGNLGIGTTSITNPYSQTPHTDVNIDGTWGGVISFKLGGTLKGWIGQRSSGNEDMVLGAAAGQNLIFYTNGTNERIRIDSSGNLLSSGATSANSTNAITLNSAGYIWADRTNNTPIYVNRRGTDGNLIEFYNDTVLQGAIIVSGTTVTYSPFMGSHYSETEDSDILFGTVMETVGSLVTNHYAEQSRLPKVKISTTEDSKAVYGVWIGSYKVDPPDADEGSADYGESIAALGASWVRVRKGEKIELGDLLCSAGDGTAKVQEDDIIRSKTIGKVTSLEIKETHADGSFVVPAVLHCG